MAEDKYRVIIKGYSSDKGEYYVEEDFAKLFKINQQQAHKILKQSPKTIKENLTKQQAEKYVSAIENCGVKCEMENMKYNLGGLSLE